MKKHNVIPNGGMRALLAGLFQRWSGEKNLPTSAINPGQPSTKSWMVFIPGTAGVVMGPVQARPDQVNDNPLGCE